MEAALTSETRSAGEVADIRHGSPFATGTARAARGEVHRPVDLGRSVGVAWGSVWAAWLITPFAAATTWSFPLGGVMIAGLGELLGLAGLSSARPRWAVAAIGLHGGLFAWSLMQML